MTSESKYNTKAQRNYEKTFDTTALVYCDECSFNKLNNLETVFLITKRTEYVYNIHFTVYTQSIQCKHNQLSVKW